jgi:hypothetical protein
MPKIIHYSSGWAKYRKLVIAAGFVFALVGAIGLSFVFKVQSENAEFTQVKTQATALRSARKPDEAIVKWSAYADKPSTSKAHRSAAWQALGVLYLSKGNNTTALEYFRRIEALTGITYTVASGAYIAANDMGDKPTALHYLEEKRRLVVLTTPGVQVEIDNMDQNIRLLKQEIAL